MGHGGLDALLARNARDVRAPEQTEVEGGEWCVPVIRCIDFASPLLAEGHLTADNGHVGRGNRLTKEPKDVHAEFTQQNALKGTGHDEDDLDAMEEDDIPYSDGKNTEVTPEKKPVECPECGNSFVP